LDGILFSQIPALRAKNFPLLRSSRQSSNQRRRFKWELRRFLRQITPSNALAKTLGEL
jgi:hypothetical protein